MLPLVFVGSSHSILQLTDICDSRNIPVAGIIDSDYWGNIDSVAGVPIIGSEKEFDWPKKFNYFIAANWIPDKTSVQIRNFDKKLKLINLVEQNKIRCVNLIHPSAIVPKSCQLGYGIFIGAGSILGDNCTLKNYCRIREQSFIAHGACIGVNSVVQVQAYIGHHVVIGSDSYVGVKSSVIPSQSDQLSISSKSFIKSHSLCTHSTLQTTIHPLIIG